MVDRMIRRSVRRTFRGVYWQPPQLPVGEPAIFVPNHHGWHDGYVMYLALSQLGLRGFHDWIEEFDRFPLFGKIGGMPFPSDDPVRRAATIRRTIRLMKGDRRSLMLFAEGILHRPPELLPFGKSLDLLVKKVPDAVVIPVGIRYEHSMHERPEAFLRFGEPMEEGPEMSRRTRLAVAKQLDRIAVDLSVAPDRFQLLHAGTKDVNERMQLSKMPGFSRLRVKMGEYKSEEPRSQ
ncbi:putative acyltransferase [Fimbriimonas ginsengisoli Gsoil 348]|uniref:Putative acyltransferase n=2 Tax=Fimbriimonas ginsengisoli TaxID=1005039 RepID=A0A068NP26_FIMGI|nr:putative acyltransferase [Fimbriimonas ginsengisoli Gsoil 348]